MGYTRYYRIEGKIDPIKFKDYSKDCKMVCEEIIDEWGRYIFSRDIKYMPDKIKRIIVIRFSE